MPSHVGRNLFAPMTGRKDRARRKPTIWPDYALPETNLPLSTAKDLSLILTQLAEVESQA